MPLRRARPSSRSSPPAVLPGRRGPRVALRPLQAPVALLSQRRSRSFASRVRRRSGLRGATTSTAEPGPARRPRVPSTRARSSRHPPAPRGQALRLHHRGRGFEPRGARGHLRRLLGPNGAGKSTTMRLLTAQAIADEERLQVLGRRLPEDSKAARAQMGVVPQQDNLDEALTVEQACWSSPTSIVWPRAGRRGPSRQRARAGQAGRAAAFKESDELSGGMRRRLLIARALVHARACCCSTSRPSASTPRCARSSWALIDRLRGEGVTMLMSTHYIEEAARLADSVTIMAEGRAVAAGPPARLVAEHAGREAVGSTGPPTAWPRWRATRGAAGPRDARARACRSWGRRGWTATCPRASGAPPASRTSSYC